MVSENMQMTYAVLHSPWSYRAAKCQHADNPSSAIRQAIQARPCKPPCLGPWPYHGLIFQDMHLPSQWAGLGQTALADAGCHANADCCSSCKAQLLPITCLPTIP